jgi:hypothetical protein
MKQYRLAGALTLAVWTFGLALLRGEAQGSLQYRVTFEGPRPIARGDAVSIAQDLEQGMWFRAIGPVPASPPYHLSRAGGGLEGFSENGTAYLRALFGDSLAVSTWSGQRFALVSVDLAEFSILYQTPLTVTFIGYRPDGSTVMTEFVTDGIIDGSGPLADFQTFNFDSRFADLVRVEIPTYGWSLDNMMFSQVPEPAAVALLVVGGLLFWALRTCLGRIRPVEETAEYAKHAEGLVIQPPSPVPDD